MLGWDRHREHTVAGRMAVDPGHRQLLDATKAAYKEAGAARITQLPNLGPGAFLVTSTRAEAAQPAAIGAQPDPAGALSLPATAYWTNDRQGFYSVSATKDGATVEQSQRVTERLAELINRRPVKQAD